MCGGCAICPSPCFVRVALSRNYTIKKRWKFFLYKENGKEWISSKVTKNGSHKIWKNCADNSNNSKFSSFFNSVEDSAEICWEPRAFSALPTVRHSGALPSRLSLISLPDSYTLPTEINNTYWGILSFFWKGMGTRAIKIIITLFSFSNYTDLNWYSEGLTKMEKHKEKVMQNFKVFSAFVLTALSAFGLH